MSFLTQSVGPYLATWNGQSVGDLEGDIDEAMQVNGVLVRCHRFGLSPVDGIVAGMSLYVTLVLKEWTAAAKAAMHPFDAALLTSGALGRMYSDLAKALVITAVSGAPAATLGPVTRTYPKAILAPEFTRQTKFAIGERNIPLTFQIFPTAAGASSSSLVFGSDT